MGHGEWYGALPGGIVLANPGIGAKTGRLLLPVHILLRGSIVTRSMKKGALSFGLVICLFGWVPAQPARVPGQALFQLQPGYSASALVERMQTQPWARQANCSLVAETMNIWLLATDPSEAPETDLLQWLNAQPEVLVAQHNHRLEHRGETPAITPDDPLYSSQWHHRNTGVGGGLSGADLASEQAWDITTGGLTPHGDTLVIAIVDSGIDPQHEDLAPNLWRNWGEIPNNGIDDDQNGYVDDFRGWNALAQNDHISGTSMTHGTPIAALAGARGSNQTGVTGVNWDVRLLFVAGNSTEAIILSAFDYALRARRRYNATQGQQGAFVVALNCSWGINGGKPSDAPLWCAAFDSLGTAGILSVGATANMPVDVDVFGDLPTTCPSDYLISVTSLTRQNQKAPNAAWGAASVDLGAYGENVFTARPNNNYGTAAGTSFAAPLVSGAIALLYAAPCHNLIAMAKANPAAAALWAKNHLLQSTIPLPALQGITRTGGRLHLFHLLKTYEDQCTSCVPPFGTAAVPVLKDSIRLSWSVVSDSLRTDIRWREKGAAAWDTLQNVNSPLMLGALRACTDYEFSLRARCANADSSAWTPPFMATTWGCCTAPDSFTATLIGPTHVALSWKGPEAAAGYSVQLTHPDGTTSHFALSENRLLLTNLLPCTVYRMVVTALCQPDTVTASAAFTFLTGNCGPCLDRNYCAAGATNADQEWIAGVQIGPWSHNPTPGKGYHNFASAVDDAPLLVIGFPVPIVLKPGYAAQVYREHFRVYVDYNGDGDFLDPGELAFDPGFPVMDAVEGVIIAPATAQPGLTRLRILMKYRGVSGAPPTPCEQFEFGQVADYCVRIEGAVNTQQPPRTLPLRLYPNPAQYRLFLAWQGTDGENVRLRFFDAAGRLEFEQRTFLGANTSTAIDLAGLPEGLFFVEITASAGSFWEKIWIKRP